MTSIQKIMLAGLALLFGYLTFSILRKGEITTSRFLAIAGVWFFFALLLFIQDKVQFAFAMLALVVSIGTFGLQLTPLLVLSDLSIVEDGKKIYLYFYNKGSIPAYRIHGYYVITTHEEVGDQTTNEKVLAFQPLDVDEEAFYPSKDASDIDFISRKLGMTESFKAQEHHLYFSIRMSYPRLELWGSKLGKKGYEGVFYYDRNYLGSGNGKWVKSSKTHLPEYFDEVFKALGKGIAPQFGTRMRPKAVGDASVATNV